MREVQAGAWHWQALHPDWEPEEGGAFDPRQIPRDVARMVSSYAVDDADRLLLFDPLAPPSEIDELAAGRETAIALTCPWHERDARGLVERLGPPVFVPSPDEGSPDVSWLRDEDSVEGHLFAPVEWLPQGLTREQIADGLHPLLELPVEVVLATHGGPNDGAALERALA